jgi:hypothetical protein
MQISSIVPYLIAYLLGVATPIVVALLFSGQDNRERTAVCIGLLVIILVVILVMIFLWAKWDLKTNFKVRLAH